MEFLKRTEPLAEDVVTREPRVTNEFHSVPFGTALATGLAANLETGHVSTPNRLLQLSLGDRLLPKYAFEEPLQGFYPGRQLLHLCGDGLQLQVAHASLYRSSTVKPSGTPY